MGCGCELKGFLTFLVLKLISTKELTGEEIRQELEKRKGQRPSPGTIYPVLKQLAENGLIEEVHTSDGKEKRYRITKVGSKEVKDATDRFHHMFAGLLEH